MLNNKGQSLVILVLLLPVLFSLIALVFEIGNLNYTLNKQKKEIKQIIEYGLNNIEKENIEEEIKNLLKANIKSNFEIKINDKIKITLKDKYKTYNYEITYIGYKENDKIIIKQE